MCEFGESIGVQCVPLVQRCYQPVLSLSRVLLLLLLLVPLHLHHHQPHC